MSHVAWSTRDTRSQELMDDPNCDLARLEKTYSQFSAVNGLVSGWQRVYRSLIRPRLSAARPMSLLDIGFGGGDIPRALARWAARDGMALQVTAIDPDERALRYVRSRPNDGVHFEAATSADVVARGERFDVVTSNHLLHHLADRELSALLADSVAVCDGIAIHNDLSRSRIAHTVYAIGALPFAGGSFVRADGLLSIRRSYRPEELQRAVPAEWRVTRMFPHRLLAMYEAGAA